MSPVLWSQRKRSKVEKSDWCPKLQVQPSSWWLYSSCVFSQPRHSGGLPRSDLMKTRWSSSLSSPPRSLFQSHFSPLARQSVVRVLNYRRKRRVNWTLPKSRCWLCKLCPAPSGGGTGRVWGGLCQVSKSIFLSHSVSLSLFTRSPEGFFFSCDTRHTLINSSRATHVESVSQSSPAMQGQGYMFLVGRVTLSLTQLKQRRKTLLNTFFILFPIFESKNIQIFLKQRGFFFFIIHRKRKMIYHMNRLHVTS